METPQPSPPTSPKSIDSTPCDKPPSYFELRRELEEMRHMEIPFGQNMFANIVDKFLPILEPSFDFDHPDNQSLITKCHRAFGFFSKWARRNRLHWVKEHVVLRRVMLKILSLEGEWYYEMDEDEAEVWVESVYICVKKIANRLFQAMSTDEGADCRALQTTIDAMYGLIQFMNRAPCRQEKFHVYHSYLVFLCQKACLSPSSFLIDPETIHVDRNSIQGNGISANVFRATMNGTLVADKTFRIFGKIKRKDTKRFLKEAILLRLVPHPHILQFLGIVMTDNSLRIISPWMENGDILAFTKKHPNESKKNLIEQVADGLHFLKQNRIVHGDLKGSNVLITSERKACIADLGASFLASSTTTNPIKFTPPNLEMSSSPAYYSIQSDNSSKLSTFSAGGTWQYMSPERLRPEDYGFLSAQATFESDIFSFGMLVYEVYAGQPPFHRLRPFKAAEYIVSGRRPTRPPGMPGSVWNLVHGCWHKDMKRRPSVFTVYSALACMP